MPERPAASSSRPTRASTAAGSPGRGCCRRGGGGDSPSEQLIEQVRAAPVQGHRFPGAAVGRAGRGGDSSGAGRDPVAGFSRRIHRLQSSVRAVPAGADGSSSVCGHIRGGYQASEVAGENMYPTYRPGGTVVTEEIGGGDIRRGDVILLSAPERVPEGLSSQRVVAPGGDRVACRHRGGVSTPNSRPLDEPYAKDGVPGAGEWSSTSRCPWGGCSCPGGQPGELVGFAVLRRRAVRHGRRRAVLGRGRARRGRAGRTTECGGRRAAALVPPPLT